MNEIQSRSPYWLSPGIDVPTRDELMPYYRPLRDFHVDRFWGEAAFVPTEDFMRETPLWRIDVLDDITEDMRRTRTHALVAYFRECQARGYDVPMARQIEAFREVCKMAGIALPDELEALLVLDQQFGRSATWGPETRPRGDRQQRLPRLVAPRPARQEPICWAALLTSADMACAVLSPAWNRP